MDGGGEGPVPNEAQKKKEPLVQHRSCDLPTYHLRSHMITFRRSLWSMVLDIKNKKPGH